MKPATLVLMFLLAGLLSNAQKFSSPVITLSALQSQRNDRYIINVFRDKNDIKLVYHFRQNVINKIESDPVISRYHNLITSPGLSFSADTLLRYASIMDSVEQDYMIAQGDSLQFDRTEKLAFDKLIDTILHTPTDILENKKVLKNRIVLDGRSVSFTIADRNDTRKAYAYGMSAQSFPLLYRLETEVMALHEKITNEKWVSRK